MPLPAPQFQLRAFGWFLRFSSSTPSSRSSASCLISGSHSRACCCESLATRNAATSVTVTPGTIPESGSPENNHEEIELLRTDYEEFLKMMTHRARVLDDADAADPEKGSEAELLEAARLHDDYEANRSLLKSLKCDAS